RADRSAWVEGKFNFAVAMTAYPQAFQQAGLVLRPGREEEDAARVRDSAIRDQLLAALDDWALVDWGAGTRQLHERLLQVAGWADPAPWKAEVRGRAAWGNRQTLEQLAGKALASKATLPRLSPQMLQLLGQLLRFQGGDAERWLRQAQALHPGDFWLNFQLG